MLKLLPSLGGMIGTGPSLEREDTNYTDLRAEARSTHKQSFLKGELRFQRDQNYCCTCVTTKRVFDDRINETFPGPRRFCRVYSKSRKNHSLLLDIYKPDETKKLERVGQRASSRMQFRFTQRTIRHNICHENCLLNYAPLLYFVLAAMLCENKACSARSTEKVFRSRSRPWGGIRAVSHPKYPRLHTAANALQCDANSRAGYLAPTHSNRKGVNEHLIPANARHRERLLNSGGVCCFAYTGRREKHQHSCVVAPKGCWVRIGDWFLLQQTKNGARIIGERGRFTVLSSPTLRDRV